MRLQDLLARLPSAELRGDPSLEIVDVNHDSRRASPGTLFVAVRGEAGKAMDIYCVRFELERITGGAPRDRVAEDLA